MLTNRIAAKEIYDLLAPLQQTLAEDVLVGAIFEAPEQLRGALRENPWKVLIEIRPISRASRPTNPDLVPILFLDGGTQYVGWQMRGILPTLFGVDFSEEIRGLGKCVSGHLVWLDAGEISGACFICSRRVTR